MKKFIDVVRHRCKTCDYCVSSEYSLIDTPDCRAIQLPDPVYYCTANPVWVVIPDHVNHYCMHHTMES